MASEQFELKNGNLFVLAEAAGGVYNGGQLRLICEVAEDVSAFLKVTEDQRIGFTVPKEKVADIQARLSKSGILVKHYRSFSTLSPKACLGELCPKCEQDALGDAIEISPFLNEKFKSTFSTLNIGMNGCATACVASATDEVHIVGDKDGYKIYIGGRACEPPQVAQLAVEKVPRKKIGLAIADILDVYSKNKQDEEKIVDVLARIGMEAFASVLTKHVGGEAEASAGEGEMPAEGGETPPIEAVPAEGEVSPVADTPAEGAEVPLAESPGGEAPITDGEAPAEMASEVPTEAEAAPADAPPVEGEAPAAEVPTEIPAEGAETPPVEAAPAEGEAAVAEMPEGGAEVPPAEAPGEEAPIADAAAPTEMAGEAPAEAPMEAPAEGEAEMKEGDAPVEMSAEGEAPPEEATVETPVEEASAPAEMKELEIVDDTAEGGGDAAPGPVDAPAPEPIDHGMEDSESAAGSEAAAASGEDMGEAGLDGGPLPETTLRNSRKTRIQIRGAHLSITLGDGSDFMVPFKSFEEGRIIEMEIEDENFIIETIDGKLCVKSGEFEMHIPLTHGTTSEFEEDEVAATAA
ncbi:hypothetical protein [Fluviispira sanaruensis]|uniref:Nitrite/sulphite reductase 4Fe-4S domain-containing protein n=1 Tax=Fluviispira sanaruensis TaxID=2493639 RepID=A0A4V0P2H8_FLUSA|nr:hypothetical protein [Fluviispira sanaruensis]BBH53277.1 hypothetical protein JCM31447_17200 [Fluviispira sanaruensis]